MPMFGVMRDIFSSDDEFMSGVEDFFSVARTTPLVAAVCVRYYQPNWTEREQPLIPRAVTPWFTALRAYSSSISPNQPPVQHQSIISLHPSDDPLNVHHYLPKSSVSIPGRAFQRALKTYRFERVYH